jgi:hypothetical protein
MRAGEIVESRIEDLRKVRKRSQMYLKSHSQWSGTP